MTRSALFRWGGLAGIVGGILVAIGFLLHPTSEGVEALTSGAWSTSHLLLLISLILGIPAVFALYLRQNKETGALGFVGFLLAYLAGVLLVGITYFESFVTPGLAAASPDALQAVVALESSGTLGTVLMITGLGFGVGWLLLGAATFRAGVLPRWGGVLALVGGVILGLQPFFPPVVWKAAAVVFGAGVVWLGYALWSAKGEAMMGGRA